MGFEARVPAGVEQAACRSSELVLIWNELVLIWKLLQLGGEVAPRGTRSVMERKVQRREHGHQPAGVDAVLLAAEGGCVDSVDARGDQPTDGARNVGVGAHVRCTCDAHARRGDRRVAPHVERRRVAPPVHRRVRLLRSEERQVVERRGERRRGKDTPA